MTQTSSGERGIEGEARLRRRDWLLLPLLSLLTIVFLAGGTELAGRLIFPISGNIKQDCMFVDLSTGLRGIPNSECREKEAESQPVEYRFNGCGHRAGMECGPKAPGTYRIAMAGTSFALGLGVAREKTFAALLPAELSRRTGRKVELYNEGLLLESPRVVALRFDELLAARPDMILWILSYWDIKNVSLLLPTDEITGDESPQAFEQGVVAPGGSAVSLAEGWFREKEELVAKRILDTARGRWHRTRSDVLLNHLMAECGSQSQYLKRWNIWHDDLGYLGAEPGPARLRHLQEFDSYAAAIEARARSSGVPIVAVYLPKGPQAALISRGEWPPEIDPYRLDDELRCIIVSHGGVYLDVLQEFRLVANPERGYLPVDGHPNADGHATIAKLLAQALTSGAVPGLRSGAQPRAALEQGR
jgi:hypothetical protein